LDGGFAASLDASVGFFIILEGLRYEKLTIFSKKGQHTIKMFAAHEWDSFEAVSLLLIKCAEQTFSIFFLAGE
jgi:hypothetical protein